MTREQAEAFLDAPDAEELASHQEAPPMLVRHPAVAPAPVDDSEPMLHYLNRSPLAPAARDWASRFSNAVGQQGENLATGLRAVGTAAQVAQIPQQLAWAGIRSNYVDPSLAARDVVTDYAGEKLAPVVGAAQRGWDWLRRVPGRVAAAVLPPPAKGRVRVRAPNGTTGTIPEWMLEDAQKQGFEPIGSE